MLGRLRFDPAFLIGAFDNGHFDIFNGDGRLIDAEHAGVFARGRAHAAGEFGKIVGLVQAFDGLFPVVAIDQIIPVRDDVADRTTALAERNPAVHASRPLGLDFFLGHGLDKFFPVLDTRLGIFLIEVLALIFHESVYITHRASLSKDNY